MIRAFIRHKELSWTHHAKSKMRQWALSESRVKRVIHSPTRIEEGIAQDTIAVMQRAGSAKNPYEIWAMIVDGKDSRKIISAWRYPGTTKPGDPLPDAILRELSHI